MNRLVTGLRAIGAAFTATILGTPASLSLVPQYLAGLLWLIEGKFRDLGREAYGGNAAVYAVVSFLCSAVAEPRMIAYTAQADGGKGNPLPYSDPLRRLLRRPNPFLTEYEHYELITLHLAIGGRYTGWKERDTLGRVIGIWPLRPDRVGPIYGDASKGQPVLLGWSYQTPGTMQYIGIPANDVILINFPDPTGESGGLVEGLGPLQALAMEVGADNEATRYVGTLIANNAQPGAVISVKRGLTGDDDIKLIKAGYMRDFGGRKRGEPAVIDQDSVITPMGFSLQQLEFPALRKVSESRIASALKVPAILVGLLVGLEAGIKATTDELRALFAETTLSGYWRRYADAFTDDLAVEFGSNIICEMDLTKVQALAGRAATRLAEIRDGFERGVVKVKEYRDALGFEDDGHGDLYLYGIAPGRGSQVQVDADGKPVNAPAEPAQTDDSSKVQPAGIRADLPSPMQHGDALIAEGTHQLTSAFDDLMATLSNG